MAKGSKKKDKSHLITLVVIGVLLVIAVIGLIVIFNLSERDPKASEKAEVVVVLKDTGAIVDLPNPEEGTLRIDFRAVESDVDVAEMPPTKVLLFRSKAIEGLNVYYLYEEKRVSAGIPLMLSPEINLLDGSHHTIIYTFKKGYKQMLLVDGNIMAEGDYSPAVKRAPTGFLVNVPDNEVEIETESAIASLSSYGTMVETGQVSIGEI